MHEGEWKDMAAENSRQFTDATCRVGGGWNSTRGSRSMDFWADVVRACQMVAPILDQLAGVGWWESAAS